MDNHTYDFAIIGGGSTGYAAAMYAARLNLKTIIFAQSPGGLIITTDLVENYPGFISITGFDLFQKIREHAQKYQIEERLTEAISIKREKREFAVQTKSEEIKTKTVLFATGAVYRKLAVPGSKKFENQGVHYCALCDGFVYKNKIVGVVGCGDSAAKESLQLVQNADKVYIICNKDVLHAEPINHQRVLENHKIEIVKNTNILEIKGDTAIKGVMLDKEYKGNQFLTLDGIFVAIGHTPNSLLAQQLGVLVNEKKQIIINRYAETNIKGVYAAGDVTDTEFKQLIIGCAEGVISAYKAFNFIQG